MRPWWVVLGGMWVWARTHGGLRWRSPQTVTLHVTTRPAGASFSVDYGSKMTTPGDVSLAKDERSHVLLIWKDGYRPEDRHVTAVADATLDVPLVSARP